MTRPSREPWLSLFETYYALREQLSDRLTPYGLSFSEYAVLAQCDRSPTRASDVARAAGLTPAGGTDILDRLERRRLVLRSVHPSDRRAILVRLTAEGRRAYRESRRGLRRLVRAVDRKMTDEERRALRVGLQSLTRALPRDTPR